MRRHHLAALRDRGHEARAEGVAAEQDERLVIRQAAHEAGEARGPWRGATRLDIVYIVEVEDADRARHDGLVRNARGLADRRRRTLKAA